MSEKAMCWCLANCRAGREDQGRAVRECSHPQVLCVLDAWRLTDHYMRCYSSGAPVGAPVCAILARGVVKPWSEILVRSFGND